MVSYSRCDTVDVVDDGGIVRLRCLMGCGWRVTSLGGGSRAHGNCILHKV